MIGALESFDCGKGSFLDNIQSGEEAEDIFEKNSRIFIEISTSNQEQQQAIWNVDKKEESNWSEEHKFGKDWSFVILESLGWNNGHMFGALWSDHIAELEAGGIFYWESRDILS